MLRKLMIILVVAVMMSSVCCQLTYSPNWGKRSHTLERCQPNVETFVNLYKYLEGEIQKVIDCSRVSGNQGL
uniref:Adipokinetic hormone 1 n=1 Tax=Lygus hesperus TaxID=30085 RepID=A0A7U0K8P1_LYGHE|nr:adipokinetic hormone 1 precursor [Lygus hesperus]